MTPEKAVEYEHFYEWLKENNLTGVPTFDDFAPEGVNKYGFNNLFPVPLYKFSKRDKTVLTLETKYSKDLSQKGWHAACIYPRETTVTRHKNGLWTVTQT